MAKDLIGIEELKTFFNAHDKAAINPKRIKDMYYEEGIVEVIVEEQTISGFSVMQEPIYAVQNPFEFIPKEGDTYIVTWDGVEYTCPLIVNDDMNMCYIGNANYVNMLGGGDVPFACIWANGLFVATESSEESHTISISRVDNVIHHLDPKYVKDMYYEEEDDGVIFENVATWVEFYRGRFTGTVPFVYNEHLLVGPEYTVVVNGVAVKGFARYVKSNGHAGTADDFASIELFARDIANDYITFTLEYTPGEAMFLTVTNSPFEETQTSFAVSLYGPPTPIVHQMDSKYIKDMYYEEVSEAIAVENITVERKDFKEAGVGLYVFEGELVDSPIEVYPDVENIIYIDTNNGLYDRFIGMGVLDNDYATNPNVQCIAYHPGESDGNYVRLTYHKETRVLELVYYRADTLHDVSSVMLSLYVDPVVTVHCVPEQYIPDTIARLSDVEAMITGAIGGSY